MHSLPFAAALVAGLAFGGQDAPRAAAPLRNVLIVVADDVGCDMVSGYGDPDAPPTPVIDALAARGVSFTRAYANPWCSPTRAALLTGRYGLRTGIGYPINRTTDQFALRDEELTLPELIERGRGAPFECSAIGKWHLSRFSDLDGPRRQGFDWFEGTLGNLGPEGGYFARRDVRNGELVESSRYATTEEVDHALARSRAMKEPWLLYLGFNAAHEPFHAPPIESSGVIFPEGREPTKPELYRAMVRSLDRELGRLLDGLGEELAERTDVIFLGDNGTAVDALDDQHRRARSKGTLFEGGIRVPLIVAGPSIAGAGRRSSELVGVVDVFATVAELFGVDARATLPPEVVLDSVSFAPLLRDPQARSRREFVLCEEFHPNGPGPYAEAHRALVSPSAKLGRDQDGAERFFDLTDPARAERPIKIADLSPAQRTEYERLAKALDALLAP